MHATNGWANMICEWQRSFFFFLLFLDSIMFIDHVANGKQCHHFILSLFIQTSARIGLEYFWSQSSGHWGRWVDLQSNTKQICEWMHSKSIWLADYLCYWIAVQCSYATNFRKARIIINYHLRYVQMLCISTAQKSSFSEEKKTYHLFCSYTNIQINREAKIP